MRRQKKQSGYVYRHGDWWMVRYRETILENGELIRRQVAKQIEPVREEHARLKRPPEEIKEKAKAKLQPLNSGAYKPESTRTLGEFVNQVYFPHLEKQLRSRKQTSEEGHLTGGFSASTVKGYKARWTSQLKARCASFQLRDFQTPDAQLVFDEIAGRNPTLRRSTLRHLKCLLSAIFRHAITKGHIASPNPIREVSIPAAPNGKQTAAHTLEEITSILLAVPLKARATLALAGFAGLRRSEITGMRWEDYDGREIHVTQSVWEGYVSEPKTTSSEDSVPVIPALARILDAYRIQFCSPNSGVMFKSETGTSMNPNNVLNRVILPALNKCALCAKGQLEHAGVDHDYIRDRSRPRWRGWHAFRRGLGTNLAELGVDDLTIQRILRHANVATTRRHYIKVRNLKVEAAMQMLEDALCADHALDATDETKSVLN